jgi:hypothetical protein
LGNDEVVLFADAVHPTHAARPVGCWAPKQDRLAIGQTNGRERINIHGAINLESGQTRMIDVQTVDAASRPSAGRRMRQARSTRRGSRSRSSTSSAPR